MRPAKRWIICQLFNVESPNFKRTSMPTYSTAKLHVMSPATSGWHLLKFEKNDWKCRYHGFGPNFSGAAFSLTPTNWRVSCFSCHLPDIQANWQIKQYQYDKINKLFNEARSPGLSSSMFSSWTTHVSSTVPTIVCENCPRPFCRWCNYIRRRNLSKSPILMIAKVFSFKW